MAALAAGLGALLGAAQTTPSREASASSAPSAV